MVNKLSDMKIIAITIIFVIVVMISIILIENKLDDEKMTSDYCNQKPIPNNCKCVGFEGEIFDADEDVCGKWQIL